MAVTWFVYWAWFVVPLLVVFMTAGALAGRFRPISRSSFRRMFLVVNVVFLLWTAASWLMFAGVIPHWDQGRYLLIGAGSPLGVAFHFAWWLIADVLLAVSWKMSRLNRRVAPA